MNTRQSPMYWSIPAGTWFATRVRISVFFPVLVLVVCLQLKSWPLGLTVSGILFVSTLLHEFGHVMAARYTGGHGDEILIWPLGGLAYVDPARNFQSQFTTALAGPAANLVLCALTLPAVIYSPHLHDVWNPLLLPPVLLESRILSDVLVLTFALNWVLLLLNLLPLYPLDGGRMLQTWLQVHSGPQTAGDIAFKVGFVVALALGILAGLTETMWLMAASLTMLFLAFLENQRIQSGDAYDESFMGYDFSQGYTSLERSQPPVSQARPTKFQKWMERRKVEKQRRRQQQDEEAEMQLDSLLAKLHEQGMNGLTEAEKRMLQRASARYRDKGKPAG